LGKSLSIFCSLVILSPFESYNHVVEAFGFRRCGVSRSWFSDNLSSLWGDVASYVSTAARGLLPTSACALFVLALLFPACSAAECIPITEARLHVGEDQCVTGKVIRVKHGSGGVTSLNFCQDSMVCPFTVVVFPHDLRNVGDVYQLQNRVIEIHGLVKDYDGRSEIILQRVRQLGGEGAHIPALPKSYDVENKGHASAGTFSLPKPAYKTSKKRQTAKIPIDIPADSDSVENSGPPR